MRRAIISLPGLQTLCTYNPTQVPQGVLRQKVIMKTTSQRLAFSPHYLTVFLLSTRLVLISMQYLFCFLCFFSSCHLGSIRTSGLPFISHCSIFTVIFTMLLVTQATWRPIVRSFIINELERTGLGRKHLWPNRNVVACRDYGEG